MSLGQFNYNGILFNSENNLYTIGIDASTSDIMSVISRAADGAIIEFSAGTHVLIETLYVQRDNITLRGEGDGSATTLLISSNVANDGIVFKGSLDSWVSTLHDSVALGSRSITVEDSTGLKVGDVLMVSQSNDAKFLSSGLYDNIIDSPFMQERPLRESIVEIESINGNVITLKHDIAYDMESGMATVQKINMLGNVGLSNLTVTYDLGTPDPDNFSNTLSAFDGANAIVFDYTQNVDISNLTIKNAASIGLEVRNALEAHIDGLVVEGAHNKGGDGNGYGLHIAGSFYGTFDNLEITDVRHAVLFSSWNAEAYNNVHVLYTNRDINYHGSDDHSNTVIVDTAIYEGSDLNTWALVSPGSIIHPYTDISKNINLFGYAIGGEKDDTVFGLDNGAQLYGGGGHDNLIGGKGDDIISGDAGNDNLTGGTGSDVFLRSFGDDGDTITDFQAGSGGDILVLNGYAGIYTLNDLIVSQNGLDAEVILYRSGLQSDTITLKNVQWSDVVLDNIVIHNASSSPVDTTLSTLQDVIHAGNGGDDIIRTALSKLGTDDIIHLGTGNDTLQLTTSSFTMYTSLYTNLTGVDVIDLTQTESAKIVISQNIIDSSDHGRITLLYGENGISRLTSSGLSPESSVYLQGQGEVILADNVSNAVNIDAGTGGMVTGLRGSDTFLIDEVTSATLNGGSGSDLFNFRTDGLTSLTTINGGDGLDTLRFSSAVNLSADDLRNVSGIERLEFLAGGSQIALAGNISGLYGADVATSIKADVSALTSPASFAIGHNANVNIIGTTAQSLTFTILDSTARITGGDESDTIIGSAGNDKFSGGGGDDILIGGFGNDTLTGGGGRDLFHVTLGNGKDTMTDFQTGAGGDVVKLTGYYHLSSLSDLSLVQENANVRLILNTKENMVFKNTAVADFTSDNFIFDNSVVMNVTLASTSGVDRLIAGGGNDLLNAYISTLTAGDTIDLGAGTDTLKFLSTKTSFDFTALSKATGVEIIDLTSTAVTKMVISQELGAGSITGDLVIKYGAQGLSGLDTSRVGAANNVVLQGGNALLCLADGSNNRVVLDRSDNVTLSGGTGNDYIRLRGGSAEIHGQGGTDSVSITGAGSWKIYGENDNDTFSFSSTAFLKNQVVQGGAGYDDLRLYDSASLTAQDIALVGGIERIVFYGTSNSLELANTLFESRLELKGNSGLLSLNIDMTNMTQDKTLVIDNNVSVTLRGESGLDYHIETTSRANGSVNGSAGNETMIGGSANDILYGNDGFDMLMGGLGNDRLDGGNGRDTLNGGRGIDTLYGGMGDDVFQYTNSNEFGDTIKDFHHDGILENDTLDLTALFDANNLGSVDVQTAFSQGYLSLQQDGFNTQVLFDRDGAASHYTASLVTTLDGVLATTLPHEALIV